MDIKNTGNNVIAKLKSDLASTGDLLIIGEDKEKLFGDDFSDDSTKNFKLTLVKKDGGGVVQREIVLVKAKDGENLTIDRAVEPVPLNDSSTEFSQTALDFNAGDYMEINLTSGNLKDVDTVAVGNKDYIDTVKAGTLKTNDGTLEIQKDDGTKGKLKLGDQILEENDDDELETTGTIKAGYFKGDGSELTNIVSNQKYILTYVKAGEDLTAGDKVKIVYNIDNDEYIVKKLDTYNIFGVVKSDTNEGNNASIILRGEIDVSDYDFNVIGMDIFINNDGDYTDTGTIDKKIGYLNQDKTLLLTTTYPSAQNIITKTTLKDNLLAYYEFNENGDDSTGNHDGTINGGISFVDGLDTLKAISGNGNDSFIDLGINPFEDDIDDVFTIIGFYKITGDFSGEKTIIGFAPSSSSVDERNTGIALCVNKDDANIVLKTGKGKNEDDYEQHFVIDYFPDLDKWFMFSFTLDGTDIKGYLRYQDGTEKEWSGTVTDGNILWNTGDYAEGHNAIGAEYDNQDDPNWIKCLPDTILIDKVGIYNRILTSDEIDLYFSQGNGPRYS